MNYLHWFVIIAETVLLIPILVFSLECLVAVGPSFKRSKETETDQDYYPSTVVLVPAHNESSNIQRTLSSITLELNSPKQIVVIADNCNDNTAELARQMGVTVLERYNEEKRGKGYAMDFGLHYLEANPPETVVMIDADCVVQKNTINQITRLAWSEQKPAQATYIMDVPINPTPKDTVSALAIIIKNSVRQFGLSKLHLPCLLTGSGMAFPWEILTKVSLANSKTTDDMQLGIDLAIAGYPPLHCHSGKVIGRLMERKFATSQRSRWEHGHLDTLLTETPRLIKEAIIQKRFNLFTLALELAVPPLSLLMLLWGGVTGMAVLVGIGWQNWWGLMISGISGGILGISLFLAWYNFARKDYPFKDLLSIPLYILWKIPMYFVFFIRPQRDWSKTERD